MKIKDYLTSFMLVENNWKFFMHSQCRLKLLSFWMEGRVFNFSSYYREEGKWSETLSLAMF